MFFADGSTGGSAYAVSVFRSDPAIDTRNGEYRSSYCSTACAHEATPRSMVATGKPTKLLPTTRVVGVVSLCRSLNHQAPASVFGFRNAQRWVVVCVLLYGDSSESRWNMLQYNSDCKLPRRQQIIHFFEPFTRPPSACTMV